MRNIDRTINSRTSMLMVCIINVMLLILTSLSHQITTKGTFAPPTSNKEMPKVQKSFGLTRTKQTEQDRTGHQQLLEHPPESSNKPHVRLIRKSLVTLDFCGVTKIVRKLCHAVSYGDHKTMIWRCYALTSVWR